MGVGAPNPNIVQWSTVYNFFNHFPTGGHLDFHFFAIKKFVHLYTYFCRISKNVIAGSAAFWYLRFLSFIKQIKYIYIKYISLNQFFLIIGQSSDSEDLPVLDNSSKCTPVKHLSVSKPQKLARSPARISPHIKDGEKDKHREKHPNSSPRTYKWSFQLSKEL